MSNPEMQQWFERHITSMRDVLTQEDLAELLKYLFTDYGDPSIDRTSVTEHLFQTFDLNHDGKIDLFELEYVWHQWWVPIQEPKSALIVVDLQNDFTSGTLSLKDTSSCRGPESLIPVVNELIEQVPWDLVVYSLDWHPKDHVSFFENRRCHAFHETCKISVEDAKLFDTILFKDTHFESGYFEQTLFPAHCVQGTWGAELHKDLKVAEKSLKIYKGGDPNVDSYSAFWDYKRCSSTALHKELQSRRITHTFICGVGYDVCAGFTAKDALELGYRTVMVEDACCGKSAADTIEMKSKLRSQHCILVDSTEVADLASGRVRPLELGIQSARMLRLPELCIS